MNQRKEAGDQGEALALLHLQQAGLTLVSRNYRCKHGEIDLIMLEQKILVLVEVRYRTPKGFGDAAASVGRDKQRRLLMAAKYLLSSQPQLRRHPVRFDVLTIEPTAQQLKINWIKDAFRV